MLRLRGKPACFFSRFNVAEIVFFCICAAQWVCLLQAGERQRQIIVGLRARQKFAFCWAHDIAAACLCLACGCVAVISDMRRIKTA